MKKGLGQRLRELFTGFADREEFFDELEDMLIEADLGAAYTMELSTELRKQRFTDRGALAQAIKANLGEVVRPAELALDPERLNVLLLLGVNGVGKTTNLAKLAYRIGLEYPQLGRVIAAGDTFRAAAVEQLTLHAQRLGVRIVKQVRGSDAGAVIFDAIESAVARNDRVLLADTAGRMHNRADLIAELKKIDAIVKRKAPNANYRSILVIDATTGQNALRQAELFHEAVGVNALLMAKYDSSARGGVLVPIARNLGIGCAYLGTGESYDALRPCDVDEYLDELLDL